MPHKLKMVLKVVIGLKNGKVVQKELSDSEAESLYGKVLGEEIRGEVLGLSGVVLQITGGSDDSGFPMRKDVAIMPRKRILMTKGVGFRGKHRKQRFEGIRVKRTVAGNFVHAKTHQLNMKCVKGQEVLEPMVVVKEKKEEKK
jgi:small subunit ribosomal protein S6e